MPCSHIEVILQGDAEYIAYLERRTGTTISLSEGDAEGYMNLMIAGPLLAVYAAHMAVMKTYHDQEHERAGKQRQTVRIEELQTQLASLENQLRDAQHRGTAGGAGA
eukprot:CAMPEP_0204519242 /NCGR_PEP_ID=MMETSP0661-20131031/4631_1 /ASSEMBLY_ACC=CAM_ASM_000606 /TAXON_ID=109239 /ORGANISM="Alexandrium margalefi, Strain AMGDE01CS-322" /LENGTH=106 /DNA_ID=CAMNT_0051524739 /DNA_START=114 /DNA_END=430 /DNA_ORIENTATION=-